MKRLLLIVPQLLFIGLAWGQDCTADDGTDGVELWGECYSIENTDSLDLYESGLTGSIPSEIGNLTNLTYLNLSTNQLTGEIPSEIGNLTNLIDLRLLDNNLTGSIPSEIGNLTNLTRLFLNENALTGSIPSEIGNLVNLVNLMLYNNQLSGSIPPEIGNLTNLIRLYLYNNQLSGIIPDEICIFENLGNSLSLSNNQLCPPYPSCINAGAQNTTNCINQVLNVPADYATIQAGIDAAIDGDTVMVAPGTYVENINYNKNIAIIGEDRETTIIDGNQNGSVVTINGDSLEIILSDFTITNGNGANAGGIIISSNNHNIYLSNLLVDNNISDCDYDCSGNGGGISIYGYNGVSLLEQLVVSNNVSRGESGYVGFGGGIYIGDQVNTSMKEVSIINNSQTSNGDGGGGGLYVGQSRINMEDCIIMNNYSYDESSDEGNGGGIYMFNSHDVIMNNVIIENNNSNRNGGGVAWISSGWENDAPFDSISMINVTIGDNFAENGAGLYVAGGRVIFLLDSVSIDNNFAESEGGGLSFTGTFANNPEHRPIVIGNEVLISNNIATFRYGGGINMDNSAFYLNSTSIVDNSISLEDEQIIRGGGITVRGDYVFEIENSIIWGNSVPAIYHYNVGADSLSINYSNVQDDGWSGEQNIGLDPLFCNPDTGNYNLHANSPCIGTGENGVNMGALDVGCEALILAPVLSDISDHQIEEDGDLIIDINATSDIGASMTFYAESDTSSVITFVEYAALIVTPEPDWYGSTNITVMVTDENDLSDTTDFTLTVTPVNDSPEDFNVLYPTVSDTFSTHVDSDTAIVFNWEESNDVDSDVTYTLTIELEFFGNTYTDVHENISDNTISISSNSLDPLLNVTSQDIATITYVVSSSDGEYMVASDVGEFVLFRAALGVNEGLSVPVMYALHQNYPNPFNPVTTLQYDLPEDALVNITIYDMMGRVVSNLVSSQQNAGYKSIQWNATNDRNEPVSSGLYIYTIQAGDYTQTKKMVLLK